MSRNFWTIFDKEYYKELKFGFERGVSVVSSPFFEALIEVRNVEFLEELLGSKSEDKWVRRAAAEALGKIGDARAVDALIEILRDENVKREVKEDAALALSSIASKSLTNLITSKRSSKAKK